MLSRLEMLENQLQIYSKNISEDELRKQLVASFEEKHKKEIIAKVTIQCLFCIIILFLFLGNHTKTAARENQHYIKTVSTPSKMIIIYIFIIAMATA